ncbi:hypothetical protein ACOMHN_031008 [Nucella lapillus]
MCQWHHKVWTCVSGTTKCGHVSVGKVVPYHIPGATKCGRVSVAPQSVDVCQWGHKVWTCVTARGTLLYCCGIMFWFTYQYLQLNALIEKLQGGDLPLAILGVPCNQFGHQEPAANRTELFNGLHYVRPGSGYVPLFNLTGRSDVNGQKALPLYTFLKSKCPPPTHASFPKVETFWDPIYPSDIVWNFEKFLIDDRGTPLLRFMPDVTPLDLETLLHDLDPKGAQLIQALRGLDERVEVRVKEKERGKKYRHH